MGSRSELANSLPTLLLPLVPLVDQVLLPTAIARVTTSWENSSALVDYLLKQAPGNDVLVAVVPLLSSKAQASHSTDTQEDVFSHPSKRSQGSHPSPADTRKDGGDRQLRRQQQPGQKESASSRSRATWQMLDLANLHSFGTLARVRQLTRVPKTGEWVLALEGVCRVAVSAAAIARQQHHFEVEVEELTPRNQSSGEGDAGEADLAAELRAATSQLLAVIQARAGSVVAQRLAAALEAAAPERAADLLASLLAPGLEGRLAMLSAADVPTRLKLVLGLVKAALAGVTDGADARSTDSSAVAIAELPAEQQQAAAQAQALRRLMNAQRTLSSGGYTPTRSPTKEDADDEEELAAVMRRLEAAKPPAEVLKVAAREYKRLKRSNDQAPGYAVSRVYLETLADLPWNTLSAPATTAGPALLAPTSGGGDTAFGTAGEAGHLGSAAGSMASPAADGVPSEGRESDEGEGSSMAERMSDAALERIPRLQPHSRPGPIELSLVAARALLDEQHYGLSKVKQRIVQYLAVRRLRGADARAPILCFVGPPGVGKTSLARSLAQVLRRPFQRIALGGVRDEAEVRGHRRTYVGALPGRIIQALRRAACRDPLLLLDEIDKMGTDASRGDPAAALLEVLDPEQNAGFVDTYLGVPFDLSKIVFLATGNRVATIPLPLLDRMELITLSGYTLDEKVHIAERHLIPKLLSEHGLSAAQLHFPRSVLEAAAAGWTREAGVRRLSQALAAVCRHVAVHVVAASEQGDAAASLGASGGEPASEGAAPEQGVSHEEPALVAPLGALWDSGHLPEFWQPARMQPQQLDSSIEVEAGSHLGTGNLSLSMTALKDTPPLKTSDGSRGLSHAMVVVDEVLLAAVLGPRRILAHDAAHRVSEAGSVAGLVWTEAGGQVQYVECAATSRGQSGRRGVLQMTGQVGEVLEESARIAMSWIQAHAAALGLPTPQPAVGRSSSSSAAAGGLSETEPRSWDVHVHLPAGAVPKDGPSAGITLAVALVSLFSGRPVRGDTAMTGELTLRGLVLPIGGVKDKLIAAHQCGIKQVIIPARNMADVEAELPASIRRQLQIVPVTHLHEVLLHAFDPPLMLLPVPKL